MSNVSQGVLSIVIDGDGFDQAGEFTYNLGIPQNEPLVSEDGSVAYKVTPQTGFIEGAIRNKGSLDVAKIMRAESITAVLALYNGKRIIGRDLVYSGEGTVSVSEGVVPLRLIGKVEEDPA